MSNVKNVQMFKCFMKRLYVEKNNLVSSGTNLTLESPSLTLFKVVFGYTPV